MTRFELCLLCVLGIVNLSAEYSVQLGLRWGEKCKIPGPNEFLKPSEECEMSKGLNCQTYQQGNLCGCIIRSSLSFDEHSGECRRKPGHHCQYINGTENPGAYERLSYNHKCHSRAECVVVEPIPETEQATATAKSKKSGRREQFTVCRCKPGYKESRDGFFCHGINSGSYVQPSFFGIIILITYFGISTSLLPT